MGPVSGHGLLERTPELNCLASSASALGGSSCDYFVPGMHAPTQRELT